MTEGAVAPAHKQTRRTQHDPLATWHWKARRWYEVTLSGCRPPCLLLGGSLAGGPAQSRSVVWAPEQPPSLGGVEGLHTWFGAGVATLPGWRGEALADAALGGGHKHHCALGSLAIVAHHLDFLWPARTRGRPGRLSALFAQIMTRGIASPAAAPPLSIPLCT